MNNLRQQINKIQKSYFTFSDLRKIAALDDESLRVAVSRMHKKRELTKLSKGYYSLPDANLDLHKLALELYRPSYLSFEWVLGQDNVLSQKPHNLTLATTKRARKITIGEQTIFYRHLRPDLFFGYILKDGYLVAETEKALLDLAYLSLNGYAKFDPEEMNLKNIAAKRLKEYLEKFHSERLTKLFKKLKIPS